MRAIHQDYTCVSPTRRQDLLSAFPNRFGILRIARLRRPIWVNQELIDTAQALALGERIDLYLGEIQWFREVSQLVGYVGFRFSKTMIIFRKGIQPKRLHPDSLE